MRIYELRNPIDVRTPKGYGKALFLIDYGVECNSLWKCRMHETGKVINFYDDQIEIYPNPINEEPPLPPSGELDEDKVAPWMAKVMMENYLKLSDNAGEESITDGLRKKALSSLGTPFKDKA